MPDFDINKPGQLKAMREQCEAMSKSMIKLNKENEKLTQRIKIAHENLFRQEQTISNIKKLINGI